MKHPNTVSPLTGGFLDPDPRQAAIERNRVAALEAFYADDLDSADFHYTEMRRLRHLIDGPTALPEQHPPDPEATEYLRKMLVAEDLGVARWTGETWK